MIEGFDLKKLQIETLIGDLFDTGIILDNKRNRFLVNLIIFCITIIVNFVKTKEFEPDVKP